MSVPSVDASSAGSLSADAPQRGVGTVLGVVFGLALIVACVVFVLRQSVGGIDGNAKLRAGFDLGTLPFELEVVKAAKLFQGEESVVLANPRAEPEPPKITPPPKEEAKTEEKPAEPAKTEPKPRFDWSKLPIGESKPPRQVALMWYPPSAGEAQIRQQFGDSFHMSARDLGDEGGLVEVESGTLVWGAYGPAFAHERLYEAGHTFRDSLRVNLSTPGQYCVMVVTWPRNSPGSKAHVDEILKALAPKPVAEAAH